jgi:Ca2+-binding EF-hand superfamily protein
MKRMQFILWGLMLLFASGAWTAEQGWVENMTDEQYQAADVNNDGELTFEEYDNWRMQYYDIYRKRSYDIFNDLDENRDGLISQEEIERGRTVPVPVEENATPGNPSVSF